MVPADKVNALAIEARSAFNLRHAPLWLCLGLARNHRLKAQTLADAIQRADELSEFLSMYWKDGKTPIAAAVKRGLAKAFTKFDAYQLAKYDRENKVRLRDVLFLTHAKPRDEYQAAVWKQLVDGTLPSPDTWEVNLSAGADKKETWLRLMEERKLGYLALLRNLRNMQQAGISKSTVAQYLETAPGRDRILPFRFVAAAKAVPQWEDIVEPAMLQAAAAMSKLPGTTAILIDVSRSMDAPLSGKSDLGRLDAAAALAILCREIAEGVQVYTFSNHLAVIPPRRGFSLRDAIVNSQPHSGTQLGAAVAKLNELAGFDRLIVITDEQSHDRVMDPAAPLAYMINVASAQNGVGYGKWTHIDGFSEQVIRFIQEAERVDSTELVAV